MTTPVWADPNPPDPVDPRAKFVLSVAGIALTALVMVTLCVVVLVQRGAFRSAVAKPDVAVVLSPANAPIAHPFANSVAAPVSVDPSAASQIGSATQGLPVSVERGVKVASGARSGLYGARRDTRACRTSELANYLAGEPNIAQTWATALGLQPREVPYYLNTLTPVLLTADTWVTVNDYIGANAVPSQTVLQAGNAVLVDPAGVPRVHCASGNPLLPPIDVDFADLKQSGPTWPGYSPQTVVAVAYSKAATASNDPVPTAPLTEFTAIDLATGEPLRLQVGNTLELADGGMSVIPLPDPVDMNAPPPVPRP